jgi:hypothetical protein
MHEFSANEVLGQWVLADAMVGEVVTDLRKIDAFGNWPGPIREPAVGGTTKTSAQRLEKDLRVEAALSSPDLMTWLREVVDVTTQRDRAVHAIALDQCMKCGSATMYGHPRSGEGVERSRDALLSVKGALRRTHRARASRGNRRVAGGESED